MKLHCHKRVISLLLLFKYWSHLWMLQWAMNSLRKCMLVQVCESCGGVSHIPVWFGLVMNV